MTFVVDTNVPIVANGGEWLEKAPECVLACEARLREINRSGRVALDNLWQIAKEYQRHLNPAGEPGVGDAFLKWVSTNMYNPLLCDLVTPAVFPDDSRLAGFDPADRKFITVALAHRENPPILQATDSKWRNFAVPLAEYGVMVEFLCA